MPLSPYINLSRAEWSALRFSTPLTLIEDDLEQLRGTNEKISLNEVETIYLPLSRLLNLYVEATQSLHSASHKFLGKPTPKVPYIIGIAGSVAVGKSTTARILQALLSRWPNHPKVDLITTDGFLYPTSILESRNLMQKKGFPQSYDRRRLLNFVAAVKSGEQRALAPVYSHHSYDIIPDKFNIVSQPDILILEGLNVLQTDPESALQERAAFVSDYFDFSIYVDANENDIIRWYVQRFLILRDTAFKDPESYFHRYSTLTDEQAKDKALQIWKEINGVNLQENILPTKSRARLILEKAIDHTVKNVKLRKL